MLGNAVVPACAEWVGERILEWEEMAATAGTGETPVLQRREARRDAKRKVNDDE
jgi:hypothetical protein